MIRPSRTIKTLLAAITSNLAKAVSWLQAGEGAHLTEADKKRTVSKTTTLKKSAKGARTEEESPRPEFGVLLIGGGLMLFLGQALAPILLPIIRWQAHLFTVLGAGLFVLAAQGFTKGRVPAWVRGPLEALSRWLKVSKSQVLMLVFAPFISFGASLAAGDGAKMNLPLIAVMVWLLAVSLVIVGNRVKNQRTKVSLWSRSEMIVVGSVILAAFLLRALWTDQIPWVLSGDEASAGLSAVEFVDGNRDNLFSIGWYSFPSMYFFLQSLSIRWIGQSIVALRISSAIVGGLTVFGLYWYVRQAFGRGAAIAAAAYLTGFHFHIHFSRIGLNNIWDGLFMVIFAGALWRAWSSNRRMTFIFAGLTLGLAQYFYISSRGLFLILPIWLAIAAIKDWKGFRQRLPGLVSMFLAMMVIFIPLARYFILHTDEFLAPHQRVTILGDWMRNEVSLTGDPSWKIILDRIKESALSFTGINLRHWYQPGYPMLLPLPAALFLLGVVLLLISLLDLQYLWVALWVILAILGGGLTESTPAAQRYVFVAPAVSLLVALPVVQSAQWLSRLWHARAQVLLILASLPLLFAIGTDLIFYFGDYAPNKRFGDNNTETATSLGFFLAEQEPGLEVYFFGPPRMGYYSLSTVPYLAPEANGVDVVTPITAPPDWPLTNSTMFVFLPERRSELAQVLMSYPEGEIINKNDKNNELLYLVYLVEQP